MILRYVLLSVFLCVSRNVGAQEILILPTPGGEGYGSLQSGGAIPSGATSLYYNPALLAESNLSATSQLHFTRSHQNLLPGLLYGDSLRQEFWGLSGLVPINDSGVQVGVGFYKNSFVNQTGVHFTSNGSSRENAYALGVGVRLNVPVSFGISAKFYESQPGLSDSSGYTSSGWAFDAGLLLRPVFSPFKEYIAPPFDLAPSLGFAWQNVGPDVYYQGTNQSSSLPQILKSSVGLQAQLSDMLEVSVEQDWEIHIADNPVDGTQTWGFIISILAYRFSQGWLDDWRQPRLESHQSHALELNALQLGRIIKRIVHKDFTSPSEDLDKIDPIYPFERIHFLGMSYLLNPCIVVGRNWIHTNDGSGRDGQSAWYWNVSL